MTKLFQIVNEIFQYAEHGDGNWGEEATAWAEAVTNALNSVQGPNDILLATATLLNNQPTPVNVTNLSFNTSDVLSFEVDFFITRIFNDGSGEETITENGTLSANFNGTLWQTSASSVGDVGVDLTVNASGQVQYTSNDLTGHISSTMRYRGKTIDQA